VSLWWCLSDVRTWCRGWEGPHQCRRGRANRQGCKEEARETSFFSPEMAVVVVVVEGEEDVPYEN